MASGLAEYERDLIRALSGENIMVCPPQIQQRLLERTRKVVKNYQNENPDATWDNIEGFLGDPHELAQLFLEGENQEVLRSYTRKRLLRRRGVWVALTVIIISLLVFLFFTKRPHEIIMEDTIVVYTAAEQNVEDALYRERPQINTPAVRIPCVRRCFTLNSQVSANVRAFPCEGGPPLVPAAAV